MAVHVGSPLAGARGLATSTSVGKVPSVSDHDDDREGDAGGGGGGGGGSGGGGGGGQVQAGAASGGGSALRRMLAANLGDAAVANPGEARQGVSRLLTFARPEASRLALALGSLAVTTGVSLAFPLAIGKIMDAALTAPGAGGYTPWQVAGVLLGLFSLQSTLIAARSAVLTISGERVAARMRRAVFKRLMEQDVAFFDRHRTGDVMSRLSVDVGLVQKAMTDNISTGLRNASMVVGGSALLFWLSPSLALLSLSMIPPIAIGGLYFGRHVKAKQKAVQEALGATSDVAEERISNVRTVRAFAKENTEVAAYGSAVDRALQRASQVALSTGVFEGSIHLATNAGLLVVLGYGGTCVLEGSMTAGTLMSFLLYSTYVGVSLASLSNTFVEVTRGIGAGLRVVDVLNSKPSIPLTIARGRADGASAAGGKTAAAEDDSDAAAAGEAATAAAGVQDGRLANVRGALSFEGLHFHYPVRDDVPVLRGFDLEVPAGKVVALVGSSGCGKSTVGALLNRSYDPQAGTIRIDGVDIKDLDAQWVRRCVGTVSQDPALFTGTIAHNIAYGRATAVDDDATGSLGAVAPWEARAGIMALTDADLVDEAVAAAVAAVPESEIIAAAKTANAHDFIMAFPDGYQTEVGERGVQLSGGQRQRVSIARAIIADPPVLLLDEATSALDAESEHAVQEAIERVMRGRTTITIAHRLSSIKSADLVAVISEGRVAELGTFDELVARPDGLFRDLVRRQLTHDVHDASGPDAQ